MSRPVVLQTKTGTASGATSTVITINTTKNSLLFVAMTATSAASPSIADTLGNLWVAQVANTTSSMLYTFYAYSSIGGNTTITITHNLNTTAVVVREYQGILMLTSTNPADQGTSTNNAGSTAMASGATGATVMPIELVIGAGSINSTLGLTVGAGYSNLTTVANSVTVAIEDLVADTAASQNATMTIAGAGAPWAMSVITFRTSTKLRPSGLRPHPFSPGLAR